MRNELRFTTEHLSVEDVAHCLRTDYATVLTWLEAGTLPAYRLPGDRWLVLAADLREHLRDNRAPQLPGIRGLS